MITKENIHQGHRERMMEKILDQSSFLQDHELLEVLLFGLIPRVDTNPIAHKLINTFGSLERVFSVSAKELMSVDGVGKNTATYLNAIGEIYKRLLSRSQKLKSTKMGSVEQARQQVMDSFKTEFEKEEVLKVFLLNIDFKIMNCLTFKVGKKDKVALSIPEIAKAIAINKPKNIIIAHNHPSNILWPSNDDDRATRQIQVVCKLHGVNLLDHFIVGSNGKIYSYNQEDRFRVIKSSDEIERLLDMEE